MPDTGEPTSRGAWLPWALLPPAGLWLAMAVLRESASFWRNAGGYPVVVRTLVQVAFYPTTVGLLLTCGSAGMFAFRREQTLPRLTMLAWLILALVLGLGLAFAGANNLSNLIDGRPLHYHPAPR